MTESAPDPEAGRWFRIFAYPIAGLIGFLILRDVYMSIDRKAREDERRLVLQELQSRSLVPQCPKFGYGKALQTSRAVSSREESSLVCYYSDAFSQEGK